MTQHIVPPRVYCVVFGALLGLTLTTTAVAFFDLGVFNTVVAMTIAVGKALLVVLYFMHVRYRPRITWVFIGAGVLWLAILMALTLSDVMTRHWLPAPAPWTAEAKPWAPQGFRRGEGSRQVARAARELPRPTSLPPIDRSGSCWTCT